MIKQYCIFCLFPLFFSAQVFAQNTGINNTTPHSRAALDVRADGVQGAILPRHPGNVNLSFGLAGVDGVGMLYYDTLSQVFRYYGGAGTWFEFGGPAGGSFWSINGNAGIGGANYLGTTDFRSLRFRTNALERMVIDSLGAVAIGAPILDAAGVKFQVSGEGGNGNMLLLHAGNGPGYQQGAIVSARARGSIAAPAALQSGDLLGTFGMMGYDGVTYGTNGPTANIDAFATENWSVGNNGTRLGFFTTPNGSNASAERMTITEQGRIGIGTINPVSDIQLLNRTHISWVDFGTENYSLFSHNLHWDGSNLVNTAGGASGFVILGEDNSHPTYSVQLYANTAANTALSNSTMRLNFRGKGLAINRDTPGAALHVRPLADSLGILVDAPGTGFSPLISMSDGNSSAYFGIRSAQTLLNPYVLTFPDDLPSAAGQVLASDLSGNLSWVNAGLKGSGTAGFVTRWTTDTTLGSGIIRDNGTFVGVNTAPSSGAARMYVIAGVGTVPAIRGESADGANASNVALLGMAAFGTSTSIGVQALASGSQSIRGMDAWATGQAGGYAYGMYSRVDGNAAYAYGIYSTVIGGSNRFPGVFLGGNVGIGTDVPAAALSVGESITPFGDVSVTVARDGGEAFFETYSGDMSEGLLMQSMSSTGDESGVIKTLFPGVGDYMAGKANNTLYIFNRDAQPIAFETNNATRMYITGAGAVGIGTTGPEALFDIKSSNNADFTKMAVFANGIDDPTFNLFASKGNASGIVAKFGLDYSNGLRNACINFHRGPANTGGFISFSTNQDIEHMRLNADGNLGIGTTIPDNRLSVNGNASKSGGGPWVAFSDKRVKKEISDFKDGLSKVLAINPVTFKYNAASGYSDTSKTYVGIIAQDMQKVMPYTISEAKSQSGETLLQYDGTALDYIFVNAFKEQQAQIETLNKKIELLEELVKKLSKADK